MSEVRHCDRCTRLFSVNEKGWSSGQMGTPVEKADGTVVTRSMQIDICGECNETTFSGRDNAARTAIASGVKPAVVDEVERRVKSNYPSERDTSREDYENRRTYPVRDNPQG